MDWLDFVKFFFSVHHTLWVKCLLPWSGTDQLSISAANWPELTPNQLDFQNQQSVCYIAASHIPRKKIILSIFLKAEKDGGRVGEEVEAELGVHACDPRI